MNLSEHETIARRTNPVAGHGMITTPHYLASQSGLAILRRGGTAVDAAIAAGAVLSVVYPQMCGLGGDAFWLVHDTARGESRALNASGRAARSASREMFAALGGIPTRGWLSAITVPGMVSGWGEAYAYSRDALGTRLSWADLLEDAIAYAEEGVPMASSLSQWLREDTRTDAGESRNLQRFAGFRKIFCAAEGDICAIGRNLRQPELAATLRQLAREGWRAFYEGDIAARIAADMRTSGGLLAEEDFAAHHADWQEPLRVNYRGFSVLNCPPNSQGMASLALLGILSQVDVRALGEGTADYYHLMIEATKLAFADRDRYLGDPEFTEIPLAELLSPAHAAAQAARIDMRRAAASVTPLDPHGDTIWLGVVDAQGTAVSMIQSVYHDFGSGIVAGNTGVLLQNRGCFFSLDPASPNCLAPGKRPFHTLNPPMLLDGGVPRLIYGTMGGEGQPQTQAALVTRIMDFGMMPQEAVCAPRWLYGRSWGEAVNNIRLESRIEMSVVEELRRRGHDVAVTTAFNDVMGHAGAIWRHPETTFLWGAADPRGDGIAAGW